MRIVLSAVKEIIEALSILEYDLQMEYEGRALTMAEQDGLSIYHSDQINNMLKANYSFITDDFVRVNISHRGIFISIKFGGNLL